MNTVTDSNFLLYAAHFYDSPFPNTEEFQEDLKRIVYIKRLFNSYNERGEMKERLILNHLIVLYNMFGDHATPMLFLKLKGYESLLKTFLSFINRMPPTVTGVENLVIHAALIPINKSVWEILNKRV